MTKGCEDFVIPRQEVFDTSRLNLAIIFNQPVAGVGISLKGKDITTEGTTPGKTTNSEPYTLKGLNKTSIRTAKVK